MITVKDVEHVAKLARLELTEEEKEKFTSQLGDVLKYVERYVIFPSRYMYSAHSLQ